MPTSADNQIATQLRDYAGWSAAPRSPALAAAIERESARLGCPSKQDYSTLLSGDRDALQALVEAAAVYESYFFREPDRLAWIRDALLIAAARRSRAPFAIWSAGCAGGEEPFTLAILASECGALDAVRITATDISQPAIARATQGRFGEWSLRGADAATRERWFAGDGESWQLDPSITRAVTFAHHNLAARSASSDGQPPAGGPFDLVVCRNVLVYFDKTLIEPVTRLLVSALAPGGTLVTGVSDPMLPVAELALDVTTIAVPGGVAYRAAR
jgi:chemotaxis protein methyltransferase CheR